MLDVDYRAWITVPNLPLEHEAAWEPLMAHLESAYADHGPIISWYDEGAKIVLSATALSETEAPVCSTTPSPKASKPSVLLTSTPQL